MSPFPLTALEEYMLCDDRAACPMTGIIRLRFSGFLDRAAWEAAVNTAVERHVLLRTTIDRTTQKRPHWVDHPDWRPVVQWQAKPNSWGYPSAGYIDLTKEPGTRVWVVERDGGHDVVLQVHHAAADALGLTRLVEDLLLAYAGHVESSQSGTPALSELDAGRFRHRGAPGLTAGRFLKMLHRQAVGLLGVREFLMHKPVPLSAGGAGVGLSASPSDFPTPCRHDFTEDETRGFLRAAKSQGVTANDLLVRDLFLAVVSWRQAQGIGDPKDWLRFSVPVNLRRTEDTRMPMANSVSSVFLDRRPLDCTDGVRLLDGIRRQMQRIKRLQLQYTFLVALGFTRMLPGGLAARMRTSKCQLTSYISNLGPVLDKVPLPCRDGRIVSGNVTLESIDYCIPRRPFVDASFCVYTYAGRLCILMHADYRALSQKAASALFDDILQRVRQSAETPVEQIASGGTG